MDNSKNVKYYINKYLDILKIMCRLQETEPFKIKYAAKKSFTLQVPFFSFFGSYYSKSYWLFDMQEIDKICKHTKVLVSFCSRWTINILAAESNLKEFLEETSSSLSSLKSSLPSQTQEIKAENKPCIEWTGACHKKSSSISTILYTVSAVLIHKQF